MLSVFHIYAGWGMGEAWLELLGLRSRLAQGVFSFVPSSCNSGAAELLGSGPPGRDDRPSTGTVIAELKLLIFFLAGRS